jgi:hypothetical protein
LKVGVSGIESHRHPADELTSLDRAAFVARERAAENAQVPTRSAILEHDPPASVISAVSCSYNIK